jgi:hypothetical protein
MKGGGRIPRAALYPRMKGRRTAGGGGRLVGGGRGDIQCAGVRGGCTSAGVGVGCRFPLASLENMMQR